MAWIKVAIFALIGGLLTGGIVDAALLEAGDCAIGAAAKAMVFGVPVGNVLGIVVYRKYFLHSLIALLACFLAAVCSALTLLAGLFAMDAFGSVPGLILALTGSCVASLFGYWLGCKDGSFMQPQEHDRMNG